MAKKKLRNIPPGSTAARSRAAKRHVPRAVEPEPTKWVSRVRHESLGGTGEMMPYSGEFKPIRGVQGPEAGTILRRITPTYAMLGAAAAAAVVLAVIQTRMSAPQHQA